MVAPKGDAASTTTLVQPDAAPSGTGDLLVRVEWKDVPAAVRASPGRTACNTPRAAAVAPTTTWGIPDVVVVVEGAPAKPGEARVVLADCAFVPRVAAGGSLIVESAMDRPQTVALAKRGALADPSKLVDGEVTKIQLPIWGHQAAIALDAGGLYELALEQETAWIVAGGAAITDAGGTTLVEDLATGSHRVTAWLPPRSGQPARIGTGTIDVPANGQAELTIELK